MTYKNVNNCKWCNMNGKDFLRLIIVAIIPLLYFALVVNKKYSSIIYNGDHVYTNITNVTVNRLTKSLCDDDQTNKWNAKPKKSIRNGKYIVLYNYFRVRLFIKYTISTWNIISKMINFQPKKTFNCLESITYTTHGEFHFMENLIPLLKRWQGMYVN